MILTATAIEQARALGAIVIDPYVPENLGPNSYDITLAPELLIYASSVLDSRAHNATLAVRIPDTGMLLSPGQLYLGSTQEVVGSYRHVPCLEGRSSLARLGLSIHQTAGFGDIGFVSRWTLEITVIVPIRIYAGMRIGQVAFHLVEGRIGKTYAGKYGRQPKLGVEASLSHLDRELQHGDGT